MTKHYNTHLVAYSKLKHIFYYYLLLLSLLFSEERESVEKVKVSFFSGKVNDSKVIQQPSIQRQPKRVSGQRSNSTMAQETLADSAKKNVTDKTKKTSRAVDTSSMVVSNVKSTNSSTKRSEHIRNNNSSLLDSSNNKKKDLKNSVGDAGKIEKTNLSHTEHVVTQHAVGNDDKRNKTEDQTNGDHIPNYNVSNGDTQSQRIVTHIQEKKNKQILVEHVKQNTEQFNRNDKNSRTNTESRNNASSSTLVNNVSQDMVSGRSNVTDNKTGKSRVLETLKINFLRKNRTSHWDRNSTSNSQENALETQRKVKLDHESDSKADSGKVGALSKSTPVGGSDKKRASELVKNNSANLQKPDVVSNGANSHQTPQGDNEMSNAKVTGHDTSTRTRTTTSAKSEKIIVNLSGKEKKSRQNKTRITTTSVNHKEVDKDTQQEEQKGKTPEKTQLTKTDLEAKTTVVHSKEQKVNASTTNTIHKRAGSTSSLAATNAQHDQKHLKPLQNGPVESWKNSALDSSKANKTIPKENTQVTKKDIIPSESESSQNHNAGSKGDERSHIESERTQNAVDKISKQPVDEMMDKVNTKQPVKGLGNSKNDPAKKKRLENMKILSTNTLERLNHSQGATRNGVGFKKVKEDVEFPSLQKHPPAGHDDLKKGMSAPYCYRESFFRKIIEKCPL